MEAARPSTSEGLRLAGNDLYKAGKIGEAIPFYEKSSRLAPDDSAPLSNLSAALYEVGDYSAAISATDKALALVVDESKRQKLVVRKAKALIYLLRFHDAAACLESLATVPDTAEIRASVLHALESRNGTDAAAAHAKLINELPRCKSAIRNVPEYYAFGHDSPECLYDDLLLRTDRRTISFLFGGIGDARNFLATLLGCWVADKKASKNKTFHFTLVDLKPAAIARDLLVLLIIDEMASVFDQPEKRLDSFLFPVFYYLYFAPVMPATIHALLQMKISRLVAILEEEQDLPPFLEVPKMFRPSIARILKEWQGEAGAEYPAGRVRKEAVRTRAEDKQALNMRLQQYGGTGPPVPEGCMKEDAFYCQTGVLVMRWAGHNRLLEDEVWKAYSDFNPARPGSLDRGFLDIVDSEWKTNPTFIDLEWQRSRNDSYADLNTVFYDPFELARNLEDAGMAGPEKQGLFNTSSYWFTAIANAFGSLRARTKIEVCVGDVTAVLEQIRYGIVGHRQNSKYKGGSDSSGDCEASELAATDSKLTEKGSKSKCQGREDEYPKAYDRIHLSNIPDYIGGSFATFIYALPLLHPDETSYVTATCLRNPPRFKSYAHFHSEYLALSDRSALQKTFGVAQNQDATESAPLWMTNYAKWHRRPIPPKLQDLLSRGQVETWLHRLFLKIAIPKNRPMWDLSLIYSPLNMTAFLRLCGHLHDIGYPAHWLGEGLVDIISGTITTRARPPRSEPLTLKEAKSNNTPLEQSTGPFIAELTTLLSLWRFALPFGVSSSQIPEIGQIHQFELDFPWFSDQIPEPPTFVLGIHSEDVLPEDATLDLRPYLLSDETANNSAEAKAVRREGIHIVSTWKWDRMKKTATFWFRKDVLDKLKHSGVDWVVMIWRTDIWAPQAGPEPISRVRDLGPFLEV